MRLPARGSDPEQVPDRSLAGAGKGNALSIRGEGRRQVSLPSVRRMGQGMGLQGSKVQQKDGRTGTGSCVIGKDKRVAVGRPRQRTLLPVRYFLRNEDAAGRVRPEIQKED